MSVVLPVYQKTDPLAEEPIARDWYGRAVRYPFRFSLRQCDGVLVFRATCQKRAECDLGHARGTFVEGLWQQDVAELFLMAPDGQYQEFNLSPSGAWWCASFSGYRERLGEVRCPSARLRADRQEQSWSAELSVSFEDLVVLRGVSLEQARGSVTAISHPAEPEYLCYGHQGGGEPDFHRADTFLPLSLV